MKPGLVSLASLEPGHEAEVAHVDPSRPIARRLLDLGFVPGTPVQVLRRAPLGDPVAYAVRGTELCLRHQEAEHIWVRREPTP